VGSTQARPLRERCPDARADFLDGSTISGGETNTVTGGQASFVAGGHNEPLTSGNYTRVGSETKNP
jgi:hypothetical protein